MDDNVSLRMVVYSFPITWNFGSPDDHLLI